MVMASLFDPSAAMSRVVDYSNPSVVRSVFRQLSWNALPRIVRSTLSVVGK
jgi:hypothetical protein